MTRLLEKILKPVEPAISERVAYQAIDRGAELRIEGGPFVRGDRLNVSALVHAATVAQGRA